MQGDLTTLFKFTQAMIHGLAKDIAEDELTHQPSAGVNPPAWLLGHLAISTDYALNLLGKEKRCPPEWHAEFGPGSQPLSQAHPYPTKAELLAAIDDGYAAVIAALPDADPAALAKPNPLPMEFLQKTLPTTGDLLAHLLTTHASFHIGHLSNWRRQMGRPPLF